MKAKGQDYQPFGLALEKEIKYRGKVKLHGQNGCATMEKTGIHAQSRSCFIDDTKFGKLILEHKDYLFSLFDEKIGKKLSIFGEMCGPGVQHGVALAQLDTLIFAVFAIQIDQELIIDPEEITTFLTSKSKDKKLPEHIYVIPWHTEELAINFAEEKKSEKSINEINEKVNAIDKEDPWVKATFGKVGAGEGLVLYPTSLVNNKNRLPVELFEAFAFKAKGDKHRVVASKAPAQVNPEVAECKEAYAKLMVTVARCQQGVGETGGLVQKNIAAFIKWITNDVQKEGKDELAASKLQWKDVQAIVGKHAREWYLKQLQSQKK